MIGIILVSIGSFFEEVSDSIGKNKVNHHKESPYTMAFLSLFWGSIFFALISIFRNEAFVFRSSSLPTFIIRSVLEIIQMYISVLAVVKCDRSTFSFVRTLTIPLLLFVDFFLGYKIGFFPIVGIFVIMMTLVILLFDKGIGKKGIGLTIFTAVNAVITISLFKYDITNFNSVAAEQLIINLILLVSFTIMAIAYKKENPLIFMKKPIFLLQSASVGIGGVIESFAYSYGAASIITAAKRSSAIFWSLLSGKRFFHEKNMLLKFFIFALLLIGLVLLSLN